MLFRPLLPPPSLKPTTVLPPAQDRTYPASSSADLFVQPEQGLLSTSDGDVPPGVRVVVEAPPARGKLQMGGDGGFKFSPTPAAGSRGPDSFTYRTEATAADGSIVKSATKTVTLDIGGVWEFEGRRGAAIGGGR
jgi:hypothetical protein